MNKLSGPIDFIRKALNLFFKKENFVYFLKIYLVVFPFTLISFAQENFFASFGDYLSVYAWLIPVTVVLGLLYLIVGFWVGVSGILAARNVVDGKSLSFLETYKESWRILAKFALLQIIVGLIVGIGFVLLIIPGILFLIWFYFSGFEMATKNTGIKESLANSKRLVSGRFWRVLGITFVFGMFNFLAQLLFSTIPFGIGKMIPTLFGGLFALPYFLLYRELSEK